MGDESNLQAKGDARLADLKAQGLSRNVIGEQLVESGFTRDEATDLIEGVRLAARPPPPPALVDVITRAARDMIASRESHGGPSDSSHILDDPTTMGFWEALLGGAREAEWILGVPEIAAAVAANEGIRLHRLMYGHRSLAPSTDARSRIDEMLANQRLFASKDDSVAAQLRIFGIGYAFRPGGRRTVQHGTSIGTSYLMLGFLPLFPAAQFVIAPGASRQWLSLGRVPLTRFHVWWRRIAAVTCAAFIGWVVLRDR